MALINGDIEAVSDPAARDRPGAHEWIVWEGGSADKAEALNSNSPHARLCERAMSKSISRPTESRREERSNLPLA
jgi:hypothetical protein